MSLNVILYEIGGAAEVLSLTAETIEHEVARLPIAAPLPAEGIILLDLGMYMETITITGTCTEAQKLLYRDGAITWYKNPNFMTTDMCQLKINSSETYKGTIKTLNFREEAAKDILSFNLIFQVYAKV